MTTPWPPEPPVQASDPARLWNGQLVQRPVVAMPTGGSFTVDLDRAPDAVRELETARDELRFLMLEAKRLGRVDPGTTDQVSLDAAAVFGAVADGGTGSLVRALEAGAQRLDLLIDSIEAELRSYRLADGDASAAFLDMDA
ncbi:hypothetical protein [Actinomycetospora chiangmaiensis]|uniref:hypothetical protein n=1 Tax=Actinomycetospora chiangmaiensis TaxID=402650 RepID=UPI001FE16C32|nr:hypothetical protein [Actinomycetospora chiangmaiensis]